VQGSGGCVCYRGAADILPGALWLIYNVLIGITASHLMLTKKILNHRDFGGGLSDSPTWKLDEDSD